MTKTADILEIFSSIQGEGLLVGERQIFIRFADCNLDCSYCDVDKNKKVLKLIVKSIIKRIKNLTKKTKRKTISLTGGEPLLQAEFLKKLLPQLKRLRFKILLETNATLLDNLKEILRYVDIISADIKLPSVARIKPCWRSHLDFIKFARKKDIFVKTVVSEKLKMYDFKKAVSLIKKIDNRIPLVIQPVTCNSSAPSEARGTDISSEKLLKLQSYALRFLEKVLVIPQVHKVLGVR